MAKAGAQHELVGLLINNFPDLAERLAEVAGVDLPGHDRMVAAPNSHRLRDGTTIETDTTVRLLDGTRTAYFAQVEMQREYRWDKLTTLRAYHGSEVRNSQSGGHMFVLSPRQSVAARFRVEEEKFREKLAYRVSYLSGLDIAPLGSEDRPFNERALALAATDFEQGIPSSAPGMLAEMRAHDDRMADLFFLAIIESGASQQEVEERMFSPLAKERFESLPSVRAWREQIIDQGRTEATAQALVSFFSAKGQVPSPEAFKAINGCTDVSVLEHWLMRAYQGESAAEIFQGAGSSKDTAPTANP
jgi:hypothetical protein